MCFKYFCKKIYTTNSEKVSLNADKIMLTDN